MKKSNPKKILLYFMVVLILFFSLFPFYWIIVTSLQSNIELFSPKPHFLPVNPTLGNYKDILFSGEITIGRSLFNSLRVSTITTIVCIFIGSLAAYAFARLRFKGSNIILLILLLTEMLPPIAILIPFFILYSDLNLLNNWLGLVLGYTSWILPISTWILYGYFQSVPKELEEAARVDGCTRIGALFKIIFPISMPGIVATGAISFISCMGEFMFALAVTTDSRAKTLTLLLSDFSNKYTTEYGKITAASLVAVIFPLILVLIFQKQLVSGLTAGSVKE